MNIGIAGVCVSECKRNIRDRDEFFEWFIVSFCISCTFARCGQHRPRRSFRVVVKKDVAVVAATAGDPRLRYCRRGGQDRA